MSRINAVKKILRDRGVEMDADDVHAILRTEPRYRIEQRDQVEREGDDRPDGNATVALEVAADDEHGTERERLRERDHREESRSWRQRR